MLLSMDASLSGAVVETSYSFYAFYPSTLNGISVIIKGKLRDGNENMMPIIIHVL